MDDRTKQALRRSTRTVYENDVEKSVSWDDIKSLAQLVSNKLYVFTLLGCI